MKVPREDIEKLLNAAAQAPSGSNSQPWHFVVHEDDGAIDVIGEPEKDHPILNFRYRGTWIAHGALIENMVVMAKSLGYVLDIQIFPDSNNSALVVRVIVQLGSKESVDDLVRAISTRTTNRKPYRAGALTKEEVHKINSVPGEGTAKLLFEYDIEKIIRLGEAVATNEVVMLENQEVHRLFFEEIVWTTKELIRRKSGLFLKTMELPLPVQLGLRLCSSWPFMNFLNKFGFAKKIASQNKKIYASGSGVGIVVVPDDDRSFIDAGRAMERVWLQFEAMGLSMHLITGIFFFQQKIASGETDIFSEEHKQLIHGAYNRVAEIFKVSPGERIAVFFRFGRAERPSATSPKQPPRVEWI